MANTDPNKSKFFRIEREFFPDIYANPADFRTTQECQDFINGAIHDVVFLRHYPEARDINITIRQGRRARRINWWRSDNSVAVPRAFRRKHLLCHAAAHLVQPEDSRRHGIEFLKIYVALVHRELGKDISTGLKKAIKDGGISLQSPRNYTDEHRQMLRERMQRINAREH